MRTSRIAALLEWAGRPWSRWRCPDESQVAAYVERRLQKDEHRRFVAHLADCNYCLRQVSSVARLLDQEMPDVPNDLVHQARGIPETLTSVSPFGWKWVSIPAAASLLLLAVAYLGIPKLHLQEPTSEVENQAPRQTRTFSRPAMLPEILEPREGEMLTGDRIHLRWREVKGTLFYRVNLVDSQGELLWEDQFEFTRAVLPPSIALEPGDKYFFWVWAYLEEGKMVKSPAVGIEIAAGK